MFPQGYRQSDHAAVRRALDCVEAYTGKGQAVWGPGIIRLADMLDRAGALNAEMLAGLVATPLIGKTQFARFDLSVQNVASACHNFERDVEKLTLEQTLDFILTSLPSQARARFASMAQRFCELPLPDTPAAEAAWYHVGHAIVYVSRRVGPDQAEEYDLLTPALVGQLASAANLAISALRNADPTEVDDLPGLIRKLGHVAKTLRVDAPITPMPAKEGEPARLSDAQLRARLTPTRVRKL